MINSKTRLRVARVAAGTVFAVGASLTAAGAAQAAETDRASAAQENDGIVGGVIGGLIGGGDSGGDTGGDTEGTTGGDTGGDTEGTVTGGIGGDTEGTDGGETDGGSTTTTGGDTEGTSGGDTGGDSGGDTGGDTGGDGGGEEPATIGGSGGGDDTCDLNDDSVECEGGNTQPDSTGSQPVEQPQAPKEELADTGSAETTYLLVGAATMIAGGVAFRVMPRMINRRTAA